jgi:hypothetical protein
MAWCVIKHRNNSANCNNVKCGVVLSARQVLQRVRSTYACDVVGGRRKDLMWTVNYSISRGPATESDRQRYVARAGIVSASQPPEHR